MLTGPQLKAIRAMRRITQQELADLAQVSQPAIAQFESGKRQLRAEALQRICKALDIKIQIVLDDKIITR